MKTSTNRVLKMGALVAFAAMGCGSDRGSVYGLESSENLALNVKQATAPGDPIWVHLIDGGEHCLVLGDDLHGTVNGAPLEAVVRGGEVAASEGYGTDCKGIALQGPAPAVGETVSIRIWDDTQTLEAEFPATSESHVSATRCAGATTCTLIRTATTK
jgi:hypothetical protein